MPRRHHVRRLIGKDLCKQSSELAPLAVFAAAAHCQRQGFQMPKGRDLGLQLFDSTRCCGLIEDFFFSGLDLIVGRFIKVLNIVRFDHRNACR